MGKERRKHARVTIDGFILFLPEGHLGQLANASVSGIAFWQPNGLSLRPGDKIRIALAYKGEEINGEAMVIHITDGLVGCEWIDFTDQKQREAYYRWLMDGNPIP